MGKGNTMFSIKAELITMSQRRSLLDSEGNVIAQLRRQKMGLIPTVYIGTPENEKKVTVKSTGILNPLQCNASITIDGKKVGKVEGNWRAKKFSIQIDGVEVAKIGKEDHCLHIYGCVFLQHHRNPQGKARRSCLHLARLHRARRDIPRLIRCPLYGNGDIRDLSKETRC